MSLKRTLVTTAEERTWPKTGEIIFLENSCFHYARTSNMPIRDLNRLLTENSRG
jgi:hypothetical protein